MKIAILGPIDTPVSKNSVGGTEIWTYSFIESLLANNNIDVTLFAQAESEVSSRTVSVCTKEELESESLPNKKFPFFTILSVAELIKRQHEFDLIHISAFSIHYILPLLELIDLPVVLTVHGSSLRDNDLKTVLSRIKQPNFVFISKYYQKSWPSVQNSIVIYSGIDTALFEFSDKKEDFYFWIGRIEPLKGTADAVIAAKKLGVKLKIAGPIRDREYFDSEIKPYLSDKIEFIGPLGEKEKIAYYQKSKATLITPKIDEPFSLVAVESMSCGTPVISLKRGAMDEIIENSKDGFLVEESDLTQTISKLEALDKGEYMKLSQMARTKAVEYFSSESMTSAYIGLYKKLLGIL